MFYAIGPTGPMPGWALALICFVMGLVFVPITLSVWRDWRDMLDFGMCAFLTACSLFCIWGIVYGLLNFGRMV